jgi:hypothetical protein
VKDLGCLGLRVDSFRFKLHHLGFRVQGSGFRVQGPGSRVQGSRFRVQGSDSGQGSNQVQG